MFINPISAASTPKYSNTTSFKKGLNPEVARNQYKILLTQDIWAEKLKVKRPETPVEKEVLLEILQNRMKLDRFARLNNLLARLKTKVDFANNMIENDPDNPDLPELLREINKQGNLDSVYKTLKKQIQMEATKHKPALDYFKNIDKLESEYLDKRLMKYSRLEKFWYQIEKNNLNPDGKYTTRDLIRIISEENKPEPKQTAPLNKKQLLDKMTRQYEDILLESLNIYSKITNHDKEAYDAKKTLAILNLSDLKRFPEITQQVGKMCANIESKITYKAQRLSGLGIYPIGTIMDDMVYMKAEIRKMTDNISQLKEQLNKNPNNQEIKTEIINKENKLKKMKESWEKGLELSIEYEQKNRQKMIDNNRIEEYEYLTNKNKVLNKYKEYYQIMKSSDGKLPPSIWNEILEG